MNKKYVYGDERPCAICSIRFRPRDKASKAICCSNKCRGKLQTLRATIKCAVCGVDFLPSRTTYVTCSRKCGTTYRISRRVPDPMVSARKALAVYCCSLIARCLREKTGKTRIMLGYSVDELRKHLEAHFEPGMGWNNYGKKQGQWSIDHTRPISSFPKDAKMNEINALENLRPMWHSQNCAKKNKWKDQ